MKKPTLSGFLALAFLTLSLTAQEPSGVTVHVASAVAPVYPPLALSAGVMGEVQVRAIIERDGSVAGVDAINGKEPLRQNRVSQETNRGEASTPQPLTFWLWC